MDEPRRRRRPERDPKAIAVRALALRDRSAGEIADRLVRAGATPAEREETVAWLQASGFVDDRRLALREAERLAGRGYGDRAIDARLAAAEIAAPFRDEAIAALEPEAERARTLAAGAAGSSSRTLAALLSRRGFGEDAIEAAVRPLDA